MRQMRVLVAATVLTVCGACLDSRQSGLHPESPPAATPAGWQTFGEGVGVSHRTPIESILTQPEAFLGRTVAVEGTIVGVCQMKGCWIELEGSPDERIQLKVEDDVIVFPVETYGRRAVAQGTVEKLTFDRRQALARARHSAEERGLEFDPQSVEPPYEELRLLGTGALIEAADTR